MYTENSELSQDRLGITVELIKSTGHALFHEQLLIYQHLAERLKQKRIFEVGCGIGLGAALLSVNNYIIATDKLGSNVRLARALYPWVNFEVHDIAEQSCTGFDATVCVDVIEHIKDYKTAIKNLIESANEVWISTPNRNNPMIGQNKPHNDYHIKEFAPEEILKIIGNKNARIRRWDTFEEVDQSTTFTPLVYQI